MDAHCPSLESFPDNHLYIDPANGLLNTTCHVHSSYTAIEGPGNLRLATTYMTIIAHTLAHNVQGIVHIKKVTSTHAALLLTGYMPLNKAKHLLVTTYTYKN